MSIHTDAAIRVAYSKGAWSSQATYRPLWGWSKRELIECLIHITAASTPSYDDALHGEAMARINLERETLKSQGIL